MSQSFQELVDQNIGRIRKIARRYASHGSEDDLVQEILMQLWKSHDRFQGNSRVETWVYRVAFNTAMTQLRVSIKHREGQSRASTIQVKQPTVEADRSQADVLNDFLATLGDVDASILMMYLDGLSADEMAEALGISSNAVGARISRMKSRFMKDHVT